MRAEMLAGQFRELEEPAEAITVSIDRDLDTIVDDILSRLAE